MAAPAARQQAEVTSNAISGWQQRVVERSLDEARKRVLTNSGAFVAAAHELIAETGSFEFTVQDVVERSGRSLRSFYQFFPSKDDLLLAVLEDAVSLFSVRLRSAMEADGDPVARLEIYTRLLWDSAGGVETGPASASNRALIAFHRHLELTRPEDLRAAYAPQRQLVFDALAAAADAGAIRTDIDGVALADLFFELTRATNHSAALGAREGVWGIDELWKFCRNALTG